MNRTELLNRAEIIYKLLTYTKTRLNKCRAWYYTDKARNEITLISYHTIVAIYTHGTVYAFIKYSSTTCQHIHKFANMYNANIVWLCDMSFYSKKENRERAKNDYSEVIKF